MKNLKDYVSTKEAAELLGVSEMTVRRWARIGKIKSYENSLSRNRLYKRSELKNILKEKFTRKTFRKHQKLEPKVFPLSLFDWGEKRKKA